ncbi:hypothetical protein EC973_004804 [Apophysomyces ossiformis]|uniref:Uncharacterized protein n=1 Tax=Apophysomyces ossiformis TaxID=679940 RepID=A0A8H7ELA6_9FUNG|nr:hypothetical protein EC973_004804 [Apophysomyces ossiformis]
MRAYIVKGVRVWATQGQVCTRSEVSGSIVNRRIEKQPRLNPQREQMHLPGPQPMVADIQTSIPMDPPVSVSHPPIALMTPEKPKRKRTPPRKLEVKTEKVDIWDTLNRTNSHISLAQLLIVDQNAAKDVQAGLCFMYGHKMQTKKVNKGKSKDVQLMAVQNLQAHVVYGVHSQSDMLVEEEGEDSGEEDDHYLFDTSEDEEFSELESEVEGNLSGYESDDTIYNYLYDPNLIKSSSPLVVLVEIKGYKVGEAVADTGASLSIISLPLAKKLRLQMNKDAMRVELLDSSLSTPNGVCENVPVHVEEQESRTYAVSKAYTARMGEEVVVELYMGEDEAHSEKGNEEIPEECFVENARLGKVKGFIHHIRTTSETPITSKPYHITWKEDEFLQQSLDKMLEDSII